MGAKKQPQDKSKKAQNKEKEKIIEDKTFGLKNKNKSATVQKYIKGVSQQVKGMPKGGERAQIESKLQDKEEKKKSAADSALLASLFKTVVNLPKDQDAKSIICSYYKQGMCQKGDKCKFSHDLNILPVQQEKPDLYHDPRPNVQNNEITCEFFFNAVKEEKYGWFWKCPNGNECIYRHALPEGYEIKKEEVKVEVDDEDKPTLEEVLDKERSALPSGLKNVTFEQFMAWVDEEKKVRDQEKLEKTKHLKGISGKALFESNQALFQDDEDAFEDYKRDEDVPDDEEESDKRFVDESEVKETEKPEEEKREEEKVEESPETHKKTDTESEGPKDPKPGQALDEPEAKN